MILGSVRVESMNFIIDTDYNFISPYAVTLLSSIVISFLIAVFLMIKSGVRKLIALVSAFINFVSCLYFGYLYSVFTSGDILEHLKIISFSSIGGLIGVAVGVIVIGSMFKEYRTRVIKAYALVIPLMYSISKIGCFLAGCCYGIEYSGIFNVVYSGSIASCTEKSLFPVQLAETLIFMVIFILGILFEYKFINKFTVPILVIICTLSKGLLDFLRHSHTNSIISINQVSCLVILIIAIVFIIFKCRTYNQDDLVHNGE